MPQAARSAQPAPRPEPQAPHKTDGDRQTQHNDQRPDAEINEPRRGPDQLLCLNLAALLLGNTPYQVNGATTDGYPLFKYLVALPHTGNLESAIEWLRRLFCIALAFMANLSFAEAVRHPPTEGSTVCDRT